MDLLPGVERSRALKTLEELRTDLVNVPNMGTDALRVRDHYLISVENAERQLASLYVDDDWVARLHSVRYWHVRELHSDSPRPLPLIQQEIEYQLRGLDRMSRDIRELDEADGALATTDLRLVLDTNAHIHYRPFDEIPWSERFAVSAIRLTVPIEVIRELDDHKNAGGRLSRRAAARLKTLHRLLAGHGRGPVGVRPGVSLEVALGNGARSQANRDEAIIAHAESLQRHGALYLVTGDLSMRLRAELRGVRVMDMPEDLHLALESGPTTH